VIVESLVRIDEVEDCGEEVSDKVVETEMENAA